MEELGLNIKFGSIGQAALIQASANTRQHLVKDVQDIGAAHIRLFNERLRIEAELNLRLKQTASIQAARIKADGAIEVATIKANAAASLAAKKEGFAREVAAAKAAAREETAARSTASRGFRVGIGAIAGQGFSVGGIASVNPYAAAGLAAAYMVKNVATDLVREATVWEKFKVALTDIEGSAVKAAQATDNLYELAKRPGIGLKEAEQTYIQFRALNMEGTKAQKVIAAVSNAVALSGGGATEFQRVNYQITQMLSKGKVLEEDLRIMRNSLPRLTVAMREAFGTTTAEGIRKAGVNAEQFLDKIVTQFEKLPTASQTLESSIENAATAWSRFKASLVDTKMVKSGLEEVTSILEAMTEAINANTKAADEAKAAEDRRRVGGKIGVMTAYGAVYDEPAKDPYADVNARAAKYGITEDYLTKGGFSSGQMSGVDKKNYEQSKLDKANAKAELDKKELARLKKLAEELANINLENTKLKITLGDQTEFEKERLILQAEYAKLSKEAGDAKIRQALADQLAFKLRLVDVKETAKAEADAAESAEAYAAAVKQSNDELDREAKAMKERAKAKADKGKDLSMQYSPEWDKLQMEYQKQQEALDQATFKNLEERNRVAKAMDDQYLRDRMEMLAKNATLVTSAGQSLFSDLANATKMGIDYRYAQEKNSIEKRLSLTGLEGDARVAQQRRRDEALEALDEKRKNDMQGAYLTMFMIAKGFALAESAIKLNLAIANAAASGPFPANLAAMAAVAAAVGSVVTNIAEINYAGAFDKGGNIPSGSWGIAGEYGPEIVQGPARVTSRADTAAMLGGKANVIVNNYGNDNVSVKQSDNGKDIEIIIGEVSKQVESNLTTGVRSGRGEFANSIKETFGLTRQGY